MQGAQAQAALNQQTAMANQGALNQQNLTQGAMNQQTALANSGQLGQFGLANLQAAQGTQALNTGEYNAGLQAQMTQAGNQMQGNENYANLVTGENTQLQGINAGISIANNANQMGLNGAYVAGGAALGGSTIQAVSDRNLKTNIKPGARSTKDFLSKFNVGKMAGQFNLMGA